MNSALTYLEGSSALTYLAGSTDGIAAYVEYVAGSTGGIGCYVEYLVGSNGGIAFLACPAIAVGGLPSQQASRYCEWRHQCTSAAFSPMQMAAQLSRQFCWRHQRKNRPPL